MRLPLFDCLSASFGCSVLTLEESVSIVFVETGVDSGGALAADSLTGDIRGALAGGLEGVNIRLVSESSLAACSAKSFIPADCNTKDDACSPKVLVEAGGTIPFCVSGLCRLLPLSCTL